MLTIKAAAPWPEEHLNTRFFISSGHIGAHHDHRRLHLRLPKPLSVAEATATFESTAPKYQGLAGLLRKNYLPSEDGARAGGVYVWETRADAERVYTADWRNMVVEAKYGVLPSVEYFESLVMVDNRDGSICVAA